MEKNKYMVRENKKSPFYHFGMVQVLEKIPKKDFYAFLSEGFSKVSAEPGDLASGILDMTGCHPYHTQKIACMVWVLTPDFLNHLKSQ